MSVLAIPPDLTSANPLLVARTPDLNPHLHSYSLLNQILGSDKARPIARYVDRNDIPHPPAPAWYLPDQNDIYIHVDDAGIKKVPVIDWRTIHGSTDGDMARILGLLCHEVGHAAISNDMTPVQMKARRHEDLLCLLEELRVENHVVRQTAQARRYLRASFAIILGNLPDTFANKSHVVRAWAITRGRTLAGVAAADETDAVDLAARTLLGDDIVDALTDLLQEALTLNLDQTWAKNRIIEICDEWVELVGETAETVGCTTCARERKPGEEPGEADAGSGGTSATTEGDDSESGEGNAADGGGDTTEGDPADEGGGKGETGDGTDTAPVPGTDPTGEVADKGGHGTWGTAGAEVDDDFDSEGIDLLTDEDAELMAMLARDLKDLMQDEWTRDLDSIDIAKSGVWAAKVFGNRKRSTRVTQSEPTAEMRRHVVQVAQVLSSLSLPTITKSTKAREVPPGRLRSREALRASADRAQGRMVAAKPWRGTVRRHATARPLVIGIATDTSGSMGWAESGVAEFAYVYANAGHRIGARTAAVTFGDTVHRIARPGEVMTHVERKSASDGTEAFDYAMAALDGVLHLTAPAYAARLLLVISDGALVKEGEPARAAEWLRRMDKAGTHVLWIRDRDMGSYYNWLPKLANKLTNLNIVDAEGSLSLSRYDAGGKVFEILNYAALEAIKEHVT